MRRREPRRSLTFRAGLGFAAILIVLFHRLFFGLILHPGAVVTFGPPFHATGDASNQQYLNLIQTDVWQQFTIFERAQYDAAWHGRFPTWNPYIYGGMPLHADAQSAFLNPFHWLYFIVDPNFARGPMAMARLWVSAMALFLLLRRHGVDAAAAFIGGAAWMLASFNIRWLLWPHTNSSLWAPVLLLALDAWIDAPTLRRFALLGLTATVWMLSGHPGTMLWVGYVAVAYVLVRLAVLKASELSWASVLRRLLGAAAGMLVGIAGAAAALLPFFLEMLRSQEWAEHKRGVMGKIDIGQTLTLFLAPEHLGWDRAAFGYHGPANYNEVACWFGLTALALAITAAVFVFVPRRFRPWAGSDLRPALPIAGAFLFAFCGLAALGIPPFQQVVEFLPLTAVTQARRLFFGMQLGGAILAAVAAHVLLRGRVRAVALVVAALMASAVATVAVLFLKDHREPFRQAWGALPPELVWKHPSVRTLVQAILAAGCCTALILVIARSWRSGVVAPVWRSLLILTICAELTWAAWDSNVPAPLAIADPPPPQSLQDVIRAAGSSRIIAAGNLLPANLGMRYGFRDLRGYDLPMARRVSAALKQGNVTLFERLVDQAGRGIDVGQVYPAIEPALATFLNRTGTRYLMNCAQYVNTTQFPAELPARSLNGGDRPWLFRGMGPTGETLYENPNAYPRAYVAKTAVPATELEAFNALGNSFHDLLERSVVEDGAWPKDQSATGGSGTSAARIVKDQAERVDLEVESERGGLLVLVDNMAPGWTVTVDDRPARALTANYLFRGVAVPAGFHRVRWTYSAPGLFTGVVVSTLTLLGLLLCLFVRRRSPRAVLQAESPRVEHAGQEDREQVPDAANDLAQ